MRAKLFALALGSVLATGAFAVTTDDPYAWLEDVHGEKQLTWVKEQNAASLGPLKSDPNYQKNYDSILEVLDATDRIPMGSLSHGFVYNFWQDAANPKGLWRRTPSPTIRMPRRVGSCCWMSMRWPNRKKKIGYSKARNVRQAKRAA